METLNNIRIPECPPAVTMTVSPEGAPVSITADGVTYVWTDKKHHRAGTALTFTAVVTGLPPNITDVEHFWDFGDGHSGYGSTVTHTYTFASPAVVRLKVTDSIGRVTETAQVMSLVPSSNASAVLSGIGTLSASATTIIFGSTMSGHGTMVTGGNAVFSGASALTGKGTLSATAV